MIHVCSLDLIANSIQKTGAQYLVSIINKDMMPETPHNIAPENHLKLSFNDIAIPTQGFVNAQSSDIEQLITFLDHWGQQAPILFHCWAGVSRSTAGAYIAANHVKGAGAEQELADGLRQAAPFASPNRLVISLADDYLKRDGQMIKAIDNIGRGSFTHGGKPFQMPL
ncbi:MAG: tyrosine protein phosphatase [Alphaproteobacteria bacterium]|nr:tyrosine protein phosphatase [Alphaproteobacteria bacterium]